MLVLLWGLLSPSLTFSQTSPVDSLDPKMEWFGDAKLGIFIHWGIYAVKGIDESWSFFNEYLSHEDYMKQAAEFGAEQYDPAQWAKLIAGSGAQYAVLTTRHHDGFSLWDTEYGSFNAVDHAKAGRDLLTPFVAAIRKEGLKVGLYYSLPDWSHEDYTHFTTRKRRYEIAEEPARWQRFQDYYRGQLGELSSQYRPDLWWFDGDWEHSAAEWQAPAIRQQLLADNPQTIINSRLTDHGDYATPEQGVPLTQPASPYWELCLTMNDSWGYQHNDHNYKSANQLIRMFVDCLRMGGNLLLDIGPKADGSIPAEQVAILEEFGRWTRKHQEAIYGSRAGIPTDYFHGPTTLSKDRKTLYLFLPHRPHGPIALRGLKNQVNRIRVVGDGTKLSHHVHNKPYWSSTPGILYIDVPERVLDPEVTVLALQLAGEIELQPLD
jgi:alpha-L-fucosidase